MNNTFAKGWTNGVKGTQKWIATEIQVYMLVLLMTQAPGILRGPLEWILPLLDYLWGQGCRTMISVSLIQ